MGASAARKARRQAQFAQKTGAHTSAYGSRVYSTAGLDLSTLKIEERDLRKSPPMSDSSMKSADTDLEKHEEKTVPSERHDDHASSSNSPDSSETSSRNKDASVVEIVADVPRPDVMTTQPCDYTPVSAPEDISEPTEKIAVMAEAPQECNKPAIKFNEIMAASEESPIEAKESSIDTQESPIEAKESPIETQESPIEVKEPPIEPEESPIETKEAPLMSRATENEFIAAMLPNFSDAKSTGERYSPAAAVWGRGRETEKEELDGDDASDLDSSEAPVGTRTDQQPIAEDVAEVEEEIDVISDSEPFGQDEMDGISDAEPVGEKEMDGNSDAEPDGEEEIIDGIPDAEEVEASPTQEVEVVVALDPKTNLEDSIPQGTSAESPPKGPDRASTTESCVKSPSASFKKEESDINDMENCPTTPTLGEKMDLRGPFQFLPLAPEIRGPWKSRGTESNCGAQTSVPEKEVFITIEGHNYRVEFHRLPEASGKTVPAAPESTQPESTRTERIPDAVPVPTTTFPLPSFIDMAPVEANPAPRTSSNISPSHSLASNHMTSPVPAKEETHQKRPSSSTQLSSSSEKSTHSNQSIATDPIGAAARLSIGPFTLTDFLEKLEVKTGATNLWTREDIASVFAELSNEELADYELPTMQLPEYIHEVLKSRVWLKKIRISTFRLGDFLGMVEFNGAGMATDEGICKGWLVAAENNNARMAKVGRLVKGLAKGW